jgi:hypothetical protein
MQNIMKNLILLIGSLLLILLTLEGITRLDIFSFKILRNHHSLFCEYDQHLGWRHKANITRTFVQSEYETTLHFNSQGIRGPMYARAKSKEEYRIVILGDSFAEGYTVNFEELFSEKLKRHLIGQTERNIEVINFGVGGYSTDQELLLFNEEAKQFRPDLTILMFYDNDVWYNTQSHYGPWGRGYKPLFRLNQNNLLLTNVPVPQPNISKESFSNRIRGILNKHSFLYRFIKYQIMHNPRLMSWAISLKIVRHPKKNLIIPKEYEIYRKAYETEISAAWELTEALLKALKQETDDIGSDLIVFYVPPKFAVYEDDWEEMKRYYMLKDDEWSVEQVSKKLQNILDSHGINFLNPLEQMRQEAKKMLALNKDRFYLKYDGHWTNKGHNLVGEILAEHILEKNDFHYLR